MDIVTYALLSKKISAAGTSIKNITIDKNGYLNFEMSDGKTIKVNANIPTASTLIDSETMEVTSDNKITFKQDAVAETVTEQISSGDIEISKISSSSIDSLFT